MKVINGKVVREVKTKDKEKKARADELQAAINEIRETVNGLRPLITELVRGYRASMSPTSEGFMPLDDFKQQVGTIIAGIHKADNFCEVANENTSQVEWFDLLEMLTDQAGIVDSMREKMEKFAAEINQEEKESDVVNNVEIE